MVTALNVGLSRPRLAVAAGAGLMFMAWVLTHLQVLTAGQDVVIRFALSSVFAMLLLFRGPRQPDAPRVRSRTLVGVALMGLVLALAGIIIGIHQFEWIGLLLLGLTCLWWVLPGRFTRDAACAVFLLYWAHPLPSQVFVPLQMTMQAASVQGAEWLLHVFNIPVWADGMVLRRGVCIYEVPSWCSGMRSATTVFLLGLGLGLFKRFRWPAMVVLLAVALVQALGLNILRLAVMVQLVPRLRDPSSVGFLHDTAGLILVASSVLLVLELGAWERLKSHWAHRAVEPDMEAEVARRSRPPFWATVYHYRWYLILVPILLLLVAEMLYKSRPAHRLAMLQRAVETLQRGDQLEAAYRLGETIRLTRPTDEAWALTVLRIQIQRGEYDQVLRRLDTLAGSDKVFAAEKRMLRAYCLMGLGRIAEAAAIVRELPQDPLNPDPRAAMILAELACQSKEPDRVAEYVLIASRWGPNMARIRKLYPYLRKHRKWDAIAGSDRELSYHDPVQVLCAAEAAMNLNRVPEVAALATEALKQWPDDPRILEPLFYMAAKRPDSPWEERFAETLPRCLKRMENPDQIYGLFDKCFALVRPDLGWMVYRRLANVDPNHPGLWLSVVRYGAGWFSFRTRYLGQSAPSASDRTDLRVLFLVGQYLPPWRSLWLNIPCAPELAGEDTVAVRKRALNEALAAFRSRASTGRLTRAMQYEYAEAMEMAGDMAGATQQLAHTASTYPDEILHTTMVLTEIHERRGEWETVYEILRPWADRQDLPPALRLRLCRAEMQLNLGLAALETSRQAVALYPYSSEAIRTHAMALRQYDSPEEALFFLSHPRTRRDPELDMLEAELLLTTSRHSELIRFVEARSLPSVAARLLPAQPLALPPAEQATVWHRVSLPSGEDFARTAETLRRNLKTASSPFLQSMMKRWLAAYEGRDGAQGVSLEGWQACGRDAREQGTALNQLCLLLCRRGDWAGARRAAEAAVRVWPQSATLWRVAVSLAQADPDVVRQARQACPADSELWLAEIVARSQKKEGGVGRAPPFESWARVEMERVAHEQAYSAGAVTRAGEYLMRGGVMQPAVVAARDAVGRSRGLLPANMLAIHCALRVRDKEWALLSVRQAMQEAIEPIPLLLRLMVEIRGGSSEAPLDEDMVVTLRQLRRNEPDNVLWSEMLTYVLFHRNGRTEMMGCLNEAKAAIEAGSRKLPVFLLGAEAARQQQLPDQAVQLLRQGLVLYPGEIALLNNLAYTLARDPATLDEARQMVPRLGLAAGNDPQVMDTIASVWIQAGSTKDAEPWVTRLERFQKDSPAWRARIRLHRAGMALIRGDIGEARRFAKALLGDNLNVPYEDIVAANQILHEADALALKTGKSTDAGKSARP